LRPTTTTTTTRQGYANGFWAYVKYLEHRPAVSTTGIPCWYGRDGLLRVCVRMDLAVGNIFPGRCAEFFCLFRIHVQHSRKQRKSICLEPGVHRRQNPSSQQLEFFVSRPGAEGQLADGFMVVHKAGCGNHLFQWLGQAEWPANLIGCFVQALVVSEDTRALIGSVVGNCGTLGPLDDFNETTRFEMSVEF
jgi:hypothetical protein